MQVVKRRRVRITDDVFKDIIVITDAPRKVIEERCIKRHTYQRLKDGRALLPLEDMLDGYYVNVLYNALIRDEDLQDMEVIGWEEHYHVDNVPRVDLSIHGGIPNLFGFIYQFGKDDFSLFIADIDTCDQDVINDVLYHYDTKGYSVRGSKAQIIEDFKEENGL